MNDKIKRCRTWLQENITYGTANKVMCETILEALDDYEKVKMIAEHNTYMRDADAKLLKELQAELEEMEKKRITNNELMQKTVTMLNEQLLEEMDKLEAKDKEIAENKEYAHKKLFEKIGEINDLRKDMTDLKDKINILIGSNVPRLQKMKIAVEALEKLARLGNGKEYGNSDGNVIAKQALDRLAEEGTK